MAGGTGLSLYYPGCDEREAAGRTSEDGANRDGLTQIGNRHYFLEKAGDMLKRREQSDLLLLRSGSSEIYQ